MSNNQNEQPERDNKLAGSVLVVEDEPATRSMVRSILEQRGCTVLTSENGTKALELVEKEPIGLVFLDLGLPDINGEEVLTQIRMSYPHIPVVILTGDSNVDIIVQCIKLGAHDYIVKPVEIARLETALMTAGRVQNLENEVKRLEELLGERQNNAFSAIVGRSPKIRKLIATARRTASIPSYVLIIGESGTGKELFARGIHYASDRSKAPFVAINCGAIPETLLESILFGHEKGAFTGASQRHIGCFEEANGGTLFLDEIGEMPMHMQVRLLRAVQERTIRRVGGNQDIPIDVRIISATNRDLQERIRNNRFREDLYYRLAVVELTIPPLRERRLDIDLLAQHFLRQINESIGGRLKGFTLSAMDILRRYDWPGNVRELSNIVERAAIFANGEYIDASDLPEVVTGKSDSQLLIHQLMGMSNKIEEEKEIEAESGSAESENTEEISRILETEPGEILTMEEVEQRVLRRAMLITGGNISEAARKLGIHRTTLHRKLAKLGLVSKES